jgi:adenosylhomocysteine nucleosidase
MDMSEPVAAGGAILMVASEAREFRGILRNCGNTVRLDWPVDFAQSADWKGHRLVCIANGPGFQLAEKAVKVAGAKERFRAVVSTGFCGGLDPRLAVGDIVEVSGVLDVQAGSRYVCGSVSSSTRTAGGLLASQDRVAETAREKAELHSSTGAIAVEMEAAVVAKFAANLGAAFFCFRAISDTASHSFSIQLNQLRDAEGRFSKGRIVLEALRKPWSRIPGLIRLDRDCKLAEIRLGEFFANCNFA